MSSLMDKAITLLNLLKEEGERGEKSSSELSRLSNLNSATTHRILKDMERHGFVSQNISTKKFFLGPSLIELGLLAKSHYTIEQVALDHMKKISADTGETVYLNIRTEKNYALLINSVESMHKLRIVEPLGMKLPLHIGSTRRVILAHLNNHEKDMYFESVELDTRTKDIKYSIESIKKDLHLIIDKGYATSYGETTQGTAGLSVPIFDGNGVVGSLSIACPQVRLSEENIPLYAELLKVHASEITKKLGGR